MKNIKKKLKEMKHGLRLNINKPPKIILPKNIYKRKLKHIENIEE